MRRTDPTLFPHQVYGTPLRRGTYTNQHVLPLAETTVTDLPDTGELKHGFQVNYTTKSFQVFAPDVEDKKKWMKLIIK